jgi:hypothetical protein
MHWNFVYEGPVDGLADALEQTEIDNTAKTQFKIVSSLLRSEAGMCKQRGLDVKIHAWGSEDSEDNTQRQTHIDIKGVKVK